MKILMLFVYLRDPEDPTVKVCNQK